MIDHVDPLEAITLEYAMNNTILEHDIATPKVCEFEIILSLKTTLQKKHLENL